MLEIVKTALRITGNAFDAELTLLINACIAELQGMGVIVDTSAEAYPLQIQMAVIAYCKWLFGNNPDKDQWREIYHTMLAQLKTMTGFTQWRPSNG